MRLRANRVKTFYLRPFMTKKDREGATYQEYGDPVPFQAEEWAGGGTAQQEMYGMRLPNIRNMRLDGTYEELTRPDGKVSFQIENMIIAAGDGVCIKDSKKVEYKVVAIYPYSFLTIELEHV